MYQSKNILLAPLQAADLEILFEWINNRNDILFSSSYTPIHFKNHIEWFDSLSGKKDIVVFAIRLKKSNTLIGTCQLHSIHQVYRSAELQIRIGDRTQKDKGYGKESLNLLLQFAFNDLNLHRVYLHVFETNECALHIYEKIGFQKEGVLRDSAFIDGEFVNVIVLGLLKSEYNGINK